MRCPRYVVPFGLSAFLTCRRPCLHLLLAAGPEPHAFHEPSFTLLSPTICHQLAGSLASIRSSLLGLHRTAVLRHDELGAETLLNLLLRSYLADNLYDQVRSPLSRCCDFAAGFKQSARNLLRQTACMYDQVGCWLWNCVVGRDRAAARQTSAAADQPPNDWPFLSMLHSGPFNHFPAHLCPPSRRSACGPRRSARRPPAPCSSSAATCTTWAASAPCRCGVRAAGRLAGCEGGASRRLQVGWLGCLWVWRSRQVSARCPSGSFPYQSQEMGKCTPPRRPVLPRSWSTQRPRTACSRRRARWAAAVAAAADCG